MTDAIDAAPHEVATQIALALQDDRPTQAQIQQLGVSLLNRHVQLGGLKPRVSSEEILEAYYRCILTDLLANRYSLTTTAIPNCINSSHRAVRRVCASSGHSHADIEDTAWDAAWVQLIKGSPRVGIRQAGSRSAQHADLYVVANDSIVSVEFKYLSSKGLQDVAGCAAQISLHARHYSEVVLVLYSGAGRGPLQVEGRLGELVRPTNARLVAIAGPEIAEVRITQRPS